jgi:Ca2+-binding RTX toxin-like protein
MCSAAALVLIPGLVAVQAGGASADPSSRARPACTITGTNGPDELKGTAGPDVICGLGGDDEIDGRGGEDVIFAGKGNDEIDGGDGDDALHGGPGRDTLSDPSGENVLDGGSGKDRVLTEVFEERQPIRLVWEMKMPGNASGLEARYTGEGSCTVGEKTVHFRWDATDQVWKADENPVFVARIGILFDCGTERASAHYILYDGNGKDVGDLWFVARDAGESQFGIRSHSGFSIQDFERQPVSVTMHTTKTSNT